MSPWRHTLPNFYAKNKEVRTTERYETMNSMLQCMHLLAPNKRHNGGPAQKARFVSCSQRGKHGSEWILGNHVRAICLRTDKVRYTDKRVNNYCVCAICFLHILHCVRPLAPSKRYNDGPVSTTHHAWVLGNCVHAVWSLYVS